MVDERSNVVPVWMTTVRGAVEKFKGASVEDQEVICVELGQKCAPEAAAKARELFAAARPKPVEAKPWIRQFPKKPVVGAAPALKVRPEVKVGRRYGWAEVVVPKGVGEIEALTYVPGLVGQIVEWIVAGASADYSWRRGFFGGERGLNRPVHV